MFYWLVGILKIISISEIGEMPDRDVTTGATGATAIAPKFSDTLTLSQPRGADSAHHPRDWSQLTFSRGYDPERH